MREPDFSIGEDVKLYRGDCLDILTELPDVDAVVPDMPYAVGVDYWG